VKSKSTLCLRLSATMQSKSQRSGDVCGYKNRLKDMGVQTSIHSRLFVLLVRREYLLGIHFYSLTATQEREDKYYICDVK